MKAQGWQEGMVPSRGSYVFFLQCSNCQKKIINLNQMYDVDKSQAQGCKRGFFLNADKGSAYCQNTWLTWGNNVFIVIIGRKNIQT